jgi:hypothetical protein
VHGIKGYVVTRVATEGNNALGKTTASIAHYFFLLDLLDLVPDLLLYLYLVFPRLTSAHHPNRRTDVQSLTWPRSTSYSQRVIKDITDTTICNDNILTTRCYPRPIVPSSTSHSTACPHQLSSDRIKTRPHPPLPAYSSPYCSFSPSGLQSNHPLRFAEV